MTVSCFPHPRHTGGSLARYDFEPLANLEDAEIEAVLARADELIAWAGDVKEFAIQAALQGKQWQDWKVVEGRSSINFYAFNSNGNKGIACGLNNLQKMRDSEPLGGKTRAEDDFADDDEDFLDCSAASFGGRRETAVCHDSEVNENGK